MKHRYFINYVTPRGFFKHFDTMSYIMLLLNAYWYFWRILKRTTMWITKKCVKYALRSNIR